MNLRFWVLQASQRALSSRAPLGLEPLKHLGEGRVGTFLSPLMPLGEVINRRQKHRTTVGLSSFLYQKTNTKALKMEIHSSHESLSWQIAFISQNEVWTRIESCLFTSTTRWMSAATNPRLLMWRRKFCQVCDDPNLGHNLRLNTQQKRSIISSINSDGRLFDS